nr:methyl-accepting chemotaxis protein [Shewanella sp.]
MFKNAKTSTLTALPSVFTSILLIIIGISCYRSFNELGETSKSLVDNTQLAETFTTVRESFFELRLATLVHNGKAIADQQHKVAQLVSQLTKFNTDFMGADAQAIHTLLPQTEHYVRLYQDELALAKQTGAVPELTAERAALGPKVSNQINQLVALITQRNHELGKQAEDKVTSTESILLGLILFAI